jgi:trk system potassium uptake protein TrkH
MRAIRDFPAFAIILLVAAVAMLLPSAFAAQAEDWRIARTFLYHALFVALLAALIGIALMNRQPSHPERYQLLTLLFVFVALPVPLALPLQALVPGLTLRDAYFEMLSSFTTTGATLFDRHWLLPAPLHLWRATVGWLGGLFILVAAFAILAPLNLGGFEIVHEETTTEGGRRTVSLALARDRVIRSLAIIGPVYATFTLALGLALTIAGDPPLVALCHAMATLSTSGISPVGGAGLAPSGILGEALIALFLFSAVSNRLFLLGRFGTRMPTLRDPQVQLMLISVLGVTLLLFVRAFGGAVEAERPASLLAAARAVWGSFFTVLSFLTTTGFESRYWLTTQAWSRLEEPGIILLGVAVMGGGIATTAGGVKLLRLYALYRHGLREMDRLVHPSTRGRRGRGEGMISERGARIAFVFLMLFLISLALVMIALSATGIAFTHSLTLAVAAMANVGPAILTLEDGTTYRSLSPGARWILCAAMIVGRMEALVLIALLNPAYWRR